MGHWPKDFVTLNSARVTDHQRGGVDEGKPRLLALRGVQVDAQRQQRRGDQCHEALIAQSVGKIALALPTDLPQVKCLEMAILRLVKADQDRHDFAER